MYCAGHKTTSRFIKKSNRDDVVQLWSTIWKLVKKLSISLFISVNHIWRWFRYLNWRSFVNARPHPNGPPATTPPHSVVTGPVLHLSYISCTFYVTGSLLYTLQGYFEVLQQHARKLLLLESERMTSDSTPHSSQQWCPLRGWNDEILGQKG